MKRCGLACELWDISTQDIGVILPAVFAYEYHEAIEHTQKVVQCFKKHTCICLIVVLLNFVQFQLQCHGVLNSWGLALGSECRSLCFRP